MQRKLNRLNDEQNKMYSFKLELKKREHGLSPSHNPREKNS